MKRPKNFNIFLFDLMQYVFDLMQYAQRNGYRKAMKKRRFFDKEVKEEKQ